MVSEVQGEGGRRKEGLEMELEMVMVTAAPPSDGYGVSAKASFHLSMARAHYT